MAVPPLPRVRVPHPHVRCDSQVLGGSPHVAGSRVPVRRLWVWHRGGTSVDTLLKRYPNLGPARVLDAISFAYDNQELIEADIAREQALFEKQGGPSVGARPLAQLALPFYGEEEEDAPAPLFGGAAGSATVPATGSVPVPVPATGSVPVPGPVPVPATGSAPVPASAPTHSRPTPSARGRGSRR